MKTTSVVANFDPVFELRAKESERERERKNKLLSFSMYLFSLKINLFP